MQRTMIRLGTGVLLLALPALAACGDDDADDGLAGGAAAIDLMTSLDIVGTDVGTGGSVTIQPTDVASSEETSAFDDLVSATAACDGYEQVIPLPRADMESAARVDLEAGSGARGWAYIVVMPDEDAAIDYLETIRTDADLHTCIHDATAAYLSGVVPSGVTVDLAPFVATASIDGFGDDQVVLTADLELIEGGATMIDTRGGSRFGRLGEVILIANGAAGMDEFASAVFGRLQAELG